MITLQIISIVLSFLFVMVGGVLSIFLPFLPGIPLAWLGVLIFGLATDFAALSLKTVLVFLLLSILVMALDFIAPFLGAKNYQASREGLIGFFIGTMIGTVFFSFIGLMCGGFLGLIFGEMFRGRESGEIRGVLRGAILGSIFGGFLKLALAAAMLTCLIFAIF